MDKPTADLNAKTSFYPTRTRYEKRVDKFLVLLYFASILNWIIPIFSFLPAMNEFSCANGGSMAINVVLFSCFIIWALFFIGQSLKRGFKKIMKRTGTALLVLLVAAGNIIMCEVYTYKLYSSEMEACYGLNIKNKDKQETAFSTFFNLK